jgi:hypothetical protein
MKYHWLILPLLFLPAILFLPACKKFLQVSPPADAKTTAQVFSSDSNATAAILSIYDNLNQGYAQPGFLSGPDELSVICGLSADEFVNYYTDPNVVAVADNQLTADNSATSLIWSSCYQTIFAANSVLEGLNGPNGVTPALNAELQGEARFIRALCNFYLTNLYGDVPLVLTIDYNANNTIKRSSQADVYQQVVADLTYAATNLSPGYTDQYNDPSAERVRPVQAAAEALLARVYLYTGNYAGAEAEAGAVIAQTGAYGLTGLDSVFLKNSRETIWSLQPPALLGMSTFDAPEFILYGPPQTVSLSASLINTFEPGDGRRNDWVGVYIDSAAAGNPTWYYAYKYKELSPPNYDPGEYSVILRLAEQYLIRAEARAQLGNIGGAQSDLNVIRARAGLAPTAAATIAGLLPAILHERQVELFSELGHRWLDLKRTGLASAVLAPLKPGWTMNALLYPVPESDITTDPNLLPQNPGY